MSPLPSGEWYNQHEDRLLRLEDQTLQILPTLARIEQMLGDVKGDLADVKGEVGGLKKSQEVVEDSGVAVDRRVVVLESADLARKNRAGAVAKWMGGILATLVAAILLTLLKIK